MALITSLNTAVRAMLAYQGALATAGHNVANATTPGFSRQRVELSTTPARDYGRFQIGTGSQIARVRRIIDMALEARIRDAATSQGTVDVRSAALGRLEGVLASLSDSDLAAAIHKFFEGAEELSLNPASIPARQQLVSRGRSLADLVRGLADELRIGRDRLNDEVQVQVEQINTLTAQIADLNRQVVLAEKGGTTPDSANDLRDRRDLMVKQLAEKIAIQVVETSNGSYTVLVGSSFLVYDNQSFALATDDEVDFNSIVSTPVFAAGVGQLTINGGQLRGALDARDGSFRGVLADLNLLAYTLVYEVNKVHSTGQGLERYRTATAENAVINSTARIAINGSATANSANENWIVDATKIGALTTDYVGRSLLVTSGNNLLERRSITAFDPATGTIFLDRDLPQAMVTGERYQVTDLPFEIQNGSFQIVVTNELSGVQTPTTINVPVLGLGTDATLETVRAQIDAIANVTATITPDGRLRVTSDNDNIRFSFAQDSSGLVAALGMATLFTGSGAFNIGLNAAVAGNLKLVAAGKTNAPGDGGNAVDLAALREQLLVRGEASFEGFYQEVVGRLGVETRDFADRLEHQMLVRQQLENQRERVSGVSLDEEAANMIVFQRAFQASARFIVVVDNLLETLISTV